MRFLRFVNFLPDQNQDKDIVLRNCFNIPKDREIDFTFSDFKNKVSLELNKMVSIDNDYVSYKSKIKEFFN